MNYKKLTLDIQKQVNLKKYNSFIQSHKPISDYDYMLIWTGIRIGTGLEEEIRLEDLQKRIPITKEEIEYYSKLKE